MKQIGKGILVGSAAYAVGLYINKKVKDAEEKLEIEQLQKEIQETLNRLQKTFELDNAKTKEVENVIGITI